MTVVSRWLVDAAFASSPQSGLAWSCFLLPGRPGEFRPEPPTDPDVNLSIHPARATLKKAAAFHQDKEFLRLGYLCSGLIIGLQVCGMCKSDQSQRRLGDYSGLCQRDVHLANSRRSQCQNTIW